MLSAAAAAHVAFRRRKKPTLRMTRDGKAVHDDEADVEPPVLAQLQANTRALADLRRSVGRLPLPPPPTSDSDGADSLPRPGSCLLL